MHKSYKQLWPTCNQFINAMFVILPNEYYVKGMIKTKLEFNEKRIREALEDAWSLKTAKQWSPENPANGQCNVTAAVVHDLYGGEILRTRYPTVWHYYNQIDDKRFDFTDSQFSRPNARFEAPEQYDDEVSNWDAAMDGTLQSEYDTLKQALLSKLSNP